VGLPNGSTIVSTSTGNLQPSSKCPAFQAHIFPDKDLDRSLVSLSEFCNAGCTATLTSDSITIHKDDQIIMKDYKNKKDMLWPLLSNITEPKDNIHTLHVAIHHKINADYVAFFHAALGSPTVNTLIQALNRGYLNNLPRLTATMVAANPPISMATDKGHLDLNRQGVNSTKTSNNPELKTSSSRDVITKLLPISDMVHSDATGRFPVISRRGNQYLLVAVFNGYIHTEAMPSRSSTSYLQAYKNTLSFFRQNNQIINFQRMDNETSEAVETYLQQERVSIQYVPPHNHRANKAESDSRCQKSYNLMSINYSCIISS
jgi:hypothetical protein